MLRTLAYATVALAPVEGYLTDIQGHLGKVAPSLLIVAWLATLFRERRAPRWTLLHAVLALLAVVVATSAAVHSPGTFTAAYTLRWLPFLVLAAVLADVAGHEMSIRGLLVAMSVGAVLAGVGALCGLLLDGHSRASGPQPDPNDLAYFLVAAIPPLFIVRRETWKWRGAVFAAGGVLVTAALATFSRGGALGLLVAAAWLSLRRVLPWRVFAGAAMAVVVLCSGALLFAGPQLTRAIQEKSFIAASNVDTRELRWEAAARMVAADPVLGVGPGGFREAYAAASHNAEIDEQTPVAHNMYFEVAAELGLPGLTLFIAMIGVAFTTSERTVRSATPAARTEAVVIQASLVAVLVMSMFLSEQYYLPLWSLVALAVATGFREHSEGKSCRCVSCT
ncbi:O-antigen ligase family protein [Amycolatopsis thailandensis]|uniref:O-antigen ligase family protein n=1 Tax=Amycolatopsis thailandensis TaxID=589330 RepID=UPI001FC9C6C9|nr:O-antigen ligase family protein [Amycolatopsis thailandensis]